MRRVHQTTDRQNAHFERADFGATRRSLYRNNIGNTNYQSLQAKLEQRLSRGLSYLICYTRSKLIDEASSVFDASILSGPVANFPVADSLNRHLERDVSNGDIPNVFVASVTYELPFGPGRSFQPHGIDGKILSGWELSAAVNLQSGIPLAVTQVTNFNAFAGFGTQRPNRIANPELPGSQRTVGRFFNTDAFQVAPQFTLGTSSRGCGTVISRNRGSFYPCSKLKINAANLR